jgi:hypothetical protein
MIYKSAYETTLGRAFHTYSIEQSLKKAIIQHGDGYFKFQEYDVISSVNFLPMQLNSENTKFVEIEHFNHPFILNHVKDKNYLVLDSRFFLKSTGNPDGALTVTNKSEYDFSLKRYFINFAWVNTSVSSIKNSLHFGSSVFSYWLSEIVSRRFSLDPLDQLKLTILSNLYYQQLFVENPVMDETFKQALASYTIKTTKAPAKLVLEIVDLITPMNKVEDFCLNVKTVLDNIRLKDFNTGMLFTIVGMNWYGLNAKENMAIALEHVPTWLSICYAAMTNKTYKTSTISNVALKYSKGGLGEEFTKNFAQITESLILAQGKQQSNFFSLEEQISELEKFEF